MIAENLQFVRQKIALAAEKSGRSSDKIKLIAVSKTVSEDRIFDAYHAGQKVFGENRVQEWQRKNPALPPDCEWHIIGRLQTNKVKYLDHRAAWIHSLDRMNLLVKLDETGKEHDMIWNTLIQVNVAQDEAKAGLEKDEVIDFLTAVKDTPHVRVHGLMTIGALEATQQETRGFFRELREIRDQVIHKGIRTKEDFSHLSMGMSQDYEIAVEEGATMIRVGSMIFGQR